jgi:hypothetical protein
MKWNYDAQTVDISMPGYIDSSLHKFQHPTPNKPQHTPHAWAKPLYGQTTQTAFPEDMSAALLSPQITCILKTFGTLLYYYARAVDPTMDVALGTLASKQSKGTKNTAKAIVQLSNYCVTRLHATSIRYTANDMILCIDSDSSYLSMPKVCSRAGGHYYLSSQSSNYLKPPTTAPLSNGPVHTVCNKI